MSRFEFVSDGCMGWNMIKHFYVKQYPTGIAC